MKSLPPESLAEEPSFDRIEYERRHSFGGGVHVQIVRLRQPDLAYELTDLPAPGIRAEAVNPPRTLSGESIRALATALAAIRISIVPPYVFGLDGWTSTLTIQSGFNKVILHWWCEPLNEWAALETALQKICTATGCHPREVSAEDRRRQVEEGWAQSEVQVRARQEDFQHRLEATRAKAIALGLATRESVNPVLFGMTRDEFGRHFSEFRVSRVHFKE